jgi:hypothetical protein
MLLLTGYFLYMMSFCLILIAVAAMHQLMLQPPNTILQLAEIIVSTTQEVLNYLSFGIGSKYVVVAFGCFSKERYLF